MTPSVCSAYNCKNRARSSDNSSEGLGFHRFPLKDEKRLKQWLKNMKWENWSPSYFSVLCTSHFEEKYIERTGLRVRLRKNAVPTIFSFPGGKKIKFIDKRSRRYQSYVDGVPPEPRPVPAVTTQTPVVKHTSTLAFTTSKPAVTKRPEPSKTKKYSTEAQKVVNGSDDYIVNFNWSVEVDETIQRIESFPRFFHNDYCKPHSIRWVSADSPDVESENVAFQDHMTPGKLTTEVKGAWEWLGMDIRGVMPMTKNGNKYVLTVTDYFSKWVEAYPLRSRTSEEVAQNIGDIISHFGYPLGILSRLSKQFVRRINRALRKQLKVTTDVTLVYFHRQTGPLDLVTPSLIDSMVSDLLKDSSENWDLHLPAKVFSLCLQEHPKTKDRPFNMLCRKALQPATSPRELLFTPAEIRTGSFGITSNQNDLQAIDDKDEVTVVLVE